MKSVADNFLEIRGIGYSNYNGRFAPYLSTYWAYRNSWTLDARVGRWTLDTGLWTLDAGLWTLDSGYWTLDPGPWTLHLGS